ncbi:uncharacterized protein AB675_9707 [Cyphellophora attinorum]|uniref:Alpha-ketoglutarate-dependent dioxygenase AlkB-like domain-containing protein n=1 Tax=Cyphellophora attinorum TaxID=1664694 RepID=A0A0N1H7E8_9EURO|nr:uncharacterized protein AB675_9707 [Phialophora attinorum]KPI42435.1 hypothetical protein AB675_9707 [Phialophora attinorum]
MASISNSEGSRAFYSHGKPVYLMSNDVEAAESFEWCRDMQKSVSSYGNVISGLRVGKLASPHELIDHSTICTFITDPKCKESTIMSREKMVRDAIEKKRVIGVLVSKDHASLVEKKIVLPEGEEWALMGAYVMTDCWKERRTGETEPHLMLRLQMVNTEDTWWESKAQSGAPTIGGQYGDCSSCKLPLQKRYREREPFCCRLQCTSASNPIDASNAPFTYAPEFLAATEDVSTVSLDDFEMLPPEPQLFSVEELERRLIPRTKRPNKPSARKEYQAGQASTREHEMSNRSCGYGIRLEAEVDNKWLQTISEEALIAECYFEMPFVEQPTPINFMNTPWEGAYVGIVFNLEDGNQIFLIVPTKESTNGSGGSRSRFQSIFSSLQSGALPVGRELIKKKQSQVPGLRSNHFGKNYGEPYNTVMETKTTPLNQQPRVLREVMDETVKIAAEVSGKDCRANENYLVAYGPNNYMDFHQDGEDDIKGDAIFSVSYGGSATMTFALTRDRLKGRIILQFPIHGNGTIVIQSGKTLNQKYRHRVDCDGIFRIVITARILLSAAEKAARDAQAKKKPKRKSKADELPDGKTNAGHESESERSDGESKSEANLKRRREAVEPAMPSEKRRRSATDEPSATPAPVDPPIATDPARMSAQTSNTPSFSTPTNGHPKIAYAHQGPRGGRSRTTTVVKLGDGKWCRRKRAGQSQ